MHFFQGWTIFEKVWLAIFTAIQIVLFFIWQQNSLELISALANMLCVVLVAKGRIENFFFGVIATSTYAYISYLSGIYGEAMLSGFFYLPMQFLGLYFWLNHKKQPTQSTDSDIRIKRLSPKYWLILVGSIVICALLYAEILSYINAQQIRLDSFNVVICIAAQILMTLRYSEQWVLWILSNVLGIAIWVNAQNYPMVMMMSAALFNALYGYYNWSKSASVSE